MIKTSLQAGLSQLQALASYIDQGNQDAAFIIYGDTKPDSVSVAANPSAELIRLNLPKPCLRSINTDSITLRSTDAAMAIKAGVAVWARLYNGNQDPVADFSFGTDIAILNPEIAIGSTLMFNTITLRPSI